MTVQGLSDEQLVALTAEAEDFVLASFAARDLVTSRDVGGHLQEHLRQASNPEVHFATMSAIVSLRSRGLVLYGEVDTIYGVVTKRKNMPLLASLLMDRDIRYRGAAVKEKQDPLSAGRPIFPTAKCLAMVAAGQRTAGPVTRWTNVDLLLDELASVYHLGSMLGAAGLARAIVEESVRLAGTDLPGFTPSGYGLASQMTEVFDEIKRNKLRKKATYDGVDRSAGIATLEHARSMGNAALHSATAPAAVDIQVLVLSTLPRAIGWLSAASDPHS